MSKKCCICKKSVKTYDNLFNAKPYKDGYCCIDCLITKVTPLRVELNKNKVEVK